MVLDILQLNKNKGDVMKTISALEALEYEKMMEMLGLNDNDVTSEEDDTDYFNAWYFGQNEEDCRFSICASL